MSKTSSGGGAAVGGSAATTGGAGATAGAAARTGDGKHDIKLPKDRGRMTTDQAAAALKQMGGHLDKSTGKFDLSSRSTSYQVRLPGGGTQRLTTREIADVVYKGQRG
jgi:NAD(P)H-hydrate repair Nnr-like enzyme with NAD(P)H-hydrate dehydratase domain